MPVGALSLPLASVLTGQPEVIGSSVLAAAAASVSFQFPPVYRAVLIDAAYIKFVTASGSIYLRCNGDSGANYAQQKITANGATVAGARLTAQAQINISNDNIGAGDDSVSSILVVKSTAAAKAQMTWIEDHEAGAPAPYLVLGGGEWGNTADLLSRIDLLASANSFAINTAITLWGYRL